MAVVTPTASSQFFAGIGLWGVIWSGLFKIEYVAKLLRLSRYVNRDRMFEWINQNKVITLLMTEILNFGLHGVESPSGVTFALGGTFTNIWMIFVILPLRQLWRGRSSTH